MRWICCCYRSVWLCCEKSWILKFDIYRLLLVSPSSGWAMVPVTDNTYRFTSRATPNRKRMPFCRIPWLCPAPLTSKLISWLLKWVDGRKHSRMDVCMMWLFMCKYIHTCIHNRQIGSKNRIKKVKSLSVGGQVAERS